MDNIVTKEQMDSLKALSEINLKISEAKNTLFALQEDETEYLVARERKAMDRIQKVVDESTELVKEADQNHAQIKQLFVEVSAFAEKLIKTQQDFRGLITEFEERNVDWERDIGRQQDELAEIRKQQKVMSIQIENERKSLEQAKKKLADDQRKLASDQGTLERAIKRLNEGRI